MGGFEIGVSERSYLLSTSASGEGWRDHLRLGDEDQKGGCILPWF